jgi:hypothetical protein
MITKKSVIEQAKVAKSYMQGGLPPYLAARRCGFERVSLMEEAIRALEANENPENTDAVVCKPESENDGSVYLKKAQVPFDPRPPVCLERENRPFYKPLKNWRNEKASISYYGPNDSLAPMYRLMLEGRAIYLNIPETSIKDVASLLCEAAGLNGPGSTGTGKEEVSEQIDSMVSDAVAGYKRRIAELETELEAKEAECVDLKLKVFDKLMAIV